MSIVEIVIGDNPSEPDLNNVSESTMHKPSVIEFYFSPKGRIRRKELFFKAFLPTFLGYVILASGFTIFSLQEPSLAGNFIYSILILLGTVLGVSQVIINIKRFHDFNASGWWTLLFIVPLINIIALMILFFKGSENHENKYGNKQEAYKLTPLKWVMFIIQLILILGMLNFYGIVTYMFENKEIQASINDAEYVTIANTDEEKLFLMPHDEGVGFIDKKGNWVTKPIYSFIGDFFEGLALVGLNAKYGFVNLKGNMVIQPIYDSVSYFRKGFSSVMLNGKWGVIDICGQSTFHKWNLIFSLIYHSCSQLEWQKST